MCAVVDVALGAGEEVAVTVGVAGIAVRVAVLVDVTMSLCGADETESKLEIIDVASGGSFFPSFVFP